MEVTAGKIMIDKTILAEQSPNPKLRPLEDR